MGFRGRLEITDGTTFIDLLGNSGGQKSIFGLLEWTPAAPDVKDGGVWMDNPLLDGRELAIRKETNITETFTLVAKSQNANDIFNAITRLRYFLNKAVGYWTNRARYPTPIYLLIQYPEETIPYWALIYDYRLPQTQNPFIQPLYKSRQAVIPEFTLVIERGLRTPITGLTCADLDFTKRWFEAQSANFQPSAGNEDCEVNLTDGTIDTTSTTGKFGVWPIDGDRYGLGIRFNNVTIPNGATIRSAYLLFVSAQTIPPPPLPSLVISGELNATPAVFSTYANYAARVRTNTQVEIPSNGYPLSWYAGNTYVVPSAQNIDSVVQEIVALAGWASGNNLVLFVEPGDNAVGYRVAAMVENATYNQIKLYVVYEGDTEIQTIDQNDCDLLPITNHMKYNQVETIMRYLTAGGIYTTLSGTAMPWTLINENNANNALYIACNLIAATPEPFYAIVLNLIEAFNPNHTVVWEYYNGAAWVALVDLVDGTSGLTVIGPAVVHWTPQADWASNAVNGVTAYWVRARVSVVGGASATKPIHSGTNEILTPGYPYIDITELPLSDSRLPIKFTFVPIGSGDDDEINYTVDEIWLASRNTDRGIKFTPFLNITSRSFELPDGISATVSAGAMTALNNSPSGLVERYNPGGVVAETDLVSLDFDNTIAPVYAGTYRVFLRRYGVTNPENLSYRLQLAVDVSGTMSVQYETNLIVDVDTTDYHLIDFGNLTIPDNLQSLSLIIRCDAAGAADTYLTDLILIPADEILIHAYQRQGADVATWVQVYNNYSIVIDGTGDNLAAWIEAGGNVVLPLQIEANAPLELDTLEDYRFWVFAGTYTGDASSVLTYPRQYWPGLDLTVAIRYLLRKI